MLDLTASPEVVAPQLLGAVLRRVTPDGVGGTDTVAVQLTEVEAYPGVGDPASHTAKGWTPRCATMFGPPGHIYVYASYGIHRAGNIVCRPAGTGAGVLMRAGRVVEGLEVARRRRRKVKDGVAVVPTDEALGRGPGNLGAVLGLDLDLDGATLAVVSG
ncbi:MAG: DNA-3-methyladenine glycosylase, partial [Candidatus Corynebacterium faecigallinarum]